MIPDFCCIAYKFSYHVVQLFCQKLSSSTKKLQDNNFLTFNSAELISDHLFSHECCHFADLLFLLYFLCNETDWIFLFLQIFFRLNARFIYKTYMFCSTLRKNLVLKQRQNLKKRKKLESKIFVWIIFKHKQQQINQSSDKFKIFLRLQLFINIYVERNFF